MRETLVRKMSRVTFPKLGYGNNLPFRAKKHFVTIHDRDAAQGITVPSMISHPITKRLRVFQYSCALRV